jgi:hypothetical protein
MKWIIGALFLVVVCLWALYRYSVKQGKHY